MITKNIRTFIETGARGVINIKMFLCVLLSFGSTVSLASEYLDTSIQSELQNTYSFTRVFESDYLYRKDAIVDEVGPQSSSTITTFHQRLLGGNIAKLPSQQVTDWIPIAGSITFFIPKERTDYPLQKRVGDNFVQSRLVRSQIHSQTGRHLLTTNFSTEAQQIDTLYNNAYALSQKSGFSKKFGERLNDEDIAPHGLDVIWPELRTISGEEVLVPVVHLAGDYSVVGHEVSFSGEQATFKSVNIVSGSITLRRNAMLATAANLVVNEGAKLLADGNLNMNVGGTLLNTGTLSASDAINITAGNYYQKTLVHRFQTHYGFNERLGLVASISATNGITINSMSDITFQGAEAQAGSSIALTAAGDIRIGTVTLSREGSYAYANSSYYTSALQHVQSSLSAGDNIDLMAGGLIEINASTLHADEGHINLLAGLGITIIDEQNQEQMVAHREYSNLTEDESAYATIAMRSVLDSGKGVRIHSAMGDITLRAADITSEEGTSVLASDGSINMLMTVENDHYSYSSIEEKLFTITNKSRGHNHETAIPNTIIGGFAAEALYGVKVQYEGKDGLTFDEQMNAFGDMEGLEWIAELRNNPDIDIDWEKIETAYEDWDESNTSLSAAAMIVIMIIVTVCTAGAGAGIVGAAAGSWQAAVANAAFTSMMSTATAASANATVNGGDPLEIVEAGYEAVLSEDGARSMATAMVTAGAMSYVNSQFFNVDTMNPDSILLNSNGTGLSITGQAAQAVADAAVRASISTAVSGRGIEEFGDNLSQLLMQNAINQLGTYMATEIGNSFDASDASNLDTALKYIAHAGAGCVIGSATAATSEGDTETGCAAGAGGAVIGEYLASQYRNEEDVLALEEDIEAFSKKQFEDVNALFGEKSSEEIRKILQNKRSEMYSELFSLRERGANLARLGAAFTALAVGADAEAINIASQTGYTAAYYNALSMRDLLLVLSDSIDELEIMLTSPEGPLELLVQKTADWVIELGVEYSDIAKIDAVLDPLLARAGLSRELLEAHNINLADPAIAAGFAAALIDTVGAGAVLLDTAIKTSLPAVILTEFESQIAAYERGEQAVLETVELIRNIDEVAEGMLATFNDAVVAGDPLAKAQVARLVGGIAIGSAMAGVTTAASAGTGGLAAFVGVPVTSFRLQKLLITLRQLSIDGKVDLGRILDTMPVSVRFGSDGRVITGVKRSEFKACSFHGDTLVRTKNGLVPIREVIANNDFVWSRNALTGEMDWRPVLAKYSNEYSEIVYIEVKDYPTGASYKIVSNKIHPFFVQTTASVKASSEGHLYQGKIENGYWIDASELKPGYRLLNSDESWSQVISVNVVIKSLMAYNLSVGGFHTYFVSGSEEVSPVWVHNTCWNSENDLPPTEPTGTTTFDEREILRGPNGERIYQGHDGRFYDANEVAPTANPASLVYQDGNRLLMERGKMRNADIIIGESDMELPPVYHEYQTPVAIRSIQAECWTADDLSVKYPDSKVYMGDESYKKIWNVDSVPSRKNKATDFFVDVGGGNFIVVDTKGGGSIDSGIEQLEIVGKQVGVNNISGYELYVNGNITGGYAINEQGFLLDGVGGLVEVNNRGVKITVVPPSYGE